MATTKRLIESALRTIGVLAAGEEAHPSEMQDALETAKQMMDGWSNESLLIPVLAHESFTLTAARSYTIGPGGDFDTTRPMFIHHLRIRDGSGYEQTIDISSLNTWAEIPWKDTETYWVQYAYYIPEFPLGRLVFSSWPQAGDALKMVSAKPITELPALTADVEYPPGYDRAIRLGLAMELGPEYGKPVDPVIAAQLRAAQTVLKRTNAKPRIPTLRVDPGLTREPRYDIDVGPQ